MTFSFSLNLKYLGVFCMPCSPSKATTTSDLSRGWAWPAGGKSPGASQAAGTRSSPSPTRRSPSVCRRRRRWSLPPRSRRGRIPSPPAPPAMAWTPSTAHHRWPGEPPSPTYPTSPLTRHPVCEILLQRDILLREHLHPDESAGKTFPLAAQYFDWPDSLEFFDLK